MAREIIGSTWNRGNRNAINSNFEELYKNYDMTEDLNIRADNILTLAREVNKKNVDVQEQLDNIILESGTSDAEVVQARGDYNLLKDRFLDIEEKQRDFNFLSNAPQPPKKGSMSNGYKLLRKMSEDSLEIIQPANQGYIRYVFTRNSGGSGYGVNYEALRVTRVEHMSNAYVSIRPSNPEEGALKNTFGWSADFQNSVFRGVLNSNHLDVNRVTYTIQGSDLSPFTIPGGNTATYSVGSVQGSNKINVAFYSRGATTQDETVNLRINGEIVRTININKAVENRVVVYDIETPFAPISPSTFKLGVENTSNNEVYIVGINVFNLKDYEGQNVSGYVSHGSTLNDFISNNGASDYAIKNAETGQNFGSYHGGEKSESCKILWRSGTQEDYEYVNFDDISINDWCAIKHFSIKQTTRLIERAYMHSIYNFDIDGTLQMDFSYEIIDGETPIPLVDFWTSLTSTDPAFTELKHPRKMTINKNDGRHNLFPATDGYVVQETTDGLQQLQIRFNRYNNAYSGFSNTSSISDQTIYKKHYYSPIRNWTEESNPIAPEVLQFSKGLDFNVY